MQEYLNKKCNRCSEVKPAGDFYKKSSNKDGLDGRCKKCVGKYHANRFKNRDLIYPETRVCLGCTVRKPATEFPKNNTSPDGLFARCRSCTADYNRQRLYGITPSEYGIIKDKQNGFCGICKETKAAVVDHDHRTGLVRGLLCHNCNRGIGLLGDDANRLMAAAKYLEENS